MSKKGGTHRHLPSEEVKYSAWRCQPKTPRIDNIVKDRRQATCRECLEHPMKCGPLSVPVRVQP